MARDRAASPSPSSSNSTPIPADTEAPASSTLADLSGLLLVDPSPGAFQEIAAALVAAVGPDDPIGRILTEMLIIAADRFRRAALLEPKDGLPGADWCRFQALAERNLRAAIKELQRHRDAPARPRPAAGDPMDPAAPGPATRPESSIEEIVDAATDWRKHIALVRSISEEWPVLLRNGREVEEVAAWFGGGKTDAELLLLFPDLSLADLAACRACDAEGLCGPFDPADGPYPPGLPVLDDRPERSP